tara:strand:+ start:997 stop:1374 length:378 start_codon:yes stop_codon:yes gene_type:complete
MSSYNSKRVNSRQNSSGSAPPQQIPGTPLQQMWTILNFHEQRLSQVSSYLQHLETGNNGNSKEQIEKPSETEQMIQYNTILQQVSELTDRVAKLEAEKNNSSTNNVSLSIEDNFSPNSTLEQSSV